MSKVEKVFIWAVCKGQPQEFHGIEVINAMVTLGRGFPETRFGGSRMTIMRDTVPASLRRPVESAGPGQTLMARVPKSTLTIGSEARAISLGKSRFARLPQEPEDARMTGVTRSLNRRLLALNVPGSLRMDHEKVLIRKIA